MAQINGTSRSENILGSDDRFDFIHAGAGNDIVRGGEGADWIDGGPGRDNISGDADFGGNILFPQSMGLTASGPYKAILYGGAGADVIDLGPVLEYCQPGIQGVGDDGDPDLIFMHGSPRPVSGFSKINQLGDNDDIRLPSGAEPTFNPIRTADADGDGRLEVASFIAHGPQNIHLKVVFANVQEFATGTDIGAAIIDEFFL